MLNILTEHTDFVRGYYYDACPYPIEDKRQRFYDFLRALQVTLVTKRLRYKAVVCKHCNVKDTNVAYQKGVDVKLVTDLMSLAQEKAFDVAIVISGDNDFVDAIEYVKSKGLQVCVASFRKNLGDDLMRVADSVIQLDRLMSKERKTI